MATRWLTEDELRTWRSFSLMQLQLFALLGRELAGDGLSYPDYLVLASLSDRVEHRARPVELGRELGWEKSRVSHHVSRMERRGLVERVPCATDQRGSFVAMTERGHDAIAAAAPSHVDVVRRHFVDLLTPEQLATLDEVAATVLAHLPDEGTGDAEP